MVFQLTFDQPYALWLFFSLPLLLFSHLYFMHHAKKQAIRFGNFKTIERVTGKRLLTKNIILLIVRCTIVIFLILAAAGTTVWRDTKNNSNDIVLLMDTSASMTAQDMGGSRIDAAKSAASDFVNSLNYSTSIGVVQFSGLSEVVQLPTSNRKDVLSAINSVKVTTAGGTDISGAIYAGVNLLVPASNGKVIILLTDGVNSLSLYDENPIPKAIGYAQKFHVVIHTIGIGTHEGASFLPVVNSEIAGFDEQNLQTIANGTGGTYAWAKDPAQLQAAYAAVLGKSSTAITPTNLSFGFLFCSLILLFVEWGLSNTRYRILP